MINQLPEELIELIWKFYYTKYILPNIINRKCNETIFLSACGVYISQCCKPATEYSLKCIDCKYNTINYY